MEHTYSNNIKKLTKLRENFRKKKKKEIKIVYIVYGKRCKQVCICRIKKSGKYARKNGIFKRFSLLTLG